MNEDFLQFIWRFQHIPHGALRCTSGRELTVLFQGHWNKHAGPDFLEARLRIGREQWVGSVEVHVKSSEWRKHGHTGDPAYNNVVLHVVYEDDEPLINEVGQEVPTLELKQWIGEGLWGAYRRFMESPNHLPCADSLNRISSSVRDVWLHRMGIERLGERYDRVERLLSIHKGDWNAVWWNTLCRSFGFGLNREAYSLLAQNLRWQDLAKIADQPARLEALLAVHSGWYALDKRLSTNTDLKREYTHLQRWLSLKTAHPAVWYRGRMKPFNQPRVRLGQLAALVHHGTAWWSTLSTCDHLDDLRDRFRVSMKATALNLAAKPGMTEIPGAASVELLIANAAIPLLFFEARRSNNADRIEQIIGWMQHMAPEKNRFARMFSAVGWSPESLLDSQGQLHLFNHYCSRKKCLSCSIGVTLLNAN
jgi:hypothetical protein